MWFKYVGCVVQSLHREDRKPVPKNSIGIHQGFDELQLLRNCLPGLGNQSGPNSTDVKSPKENKPEKYCLRELSVPQVCRNGLKRKREGKRKSLQEGIGHPRDVALLSCSSEVLSKEGVCIQNQRGEYRFQSLNLISRFGLIQSKYIEFERDPAIYF